MENTFNSGLIMIGWVRSGPLEMAGSEKFFLEVRIHLMHISYIPDFQSTA